MDAMETISGRAVVIIDWHSLEQLLKKVPLKTLRWFVGKHADGAVVLDLAKVKRQELIDALFIETEG